MARFDLGDVVGSIADLRDASDCSQTVAAFVQFAAAFAHFLRESDFLRLATAIPHLTQLRQLASRAGDAESLASLHLAVARVEGLSRSLSDAPTITWRWLERLRRGRTNVALQLHGRPHRCFA